MTFDAAGDEWAPLGSFVCLGDAMRAAATSAFPASVLAISMERGYVFTLVLLLVRHPLQEAR